MDYILNYFREFLYLLNEMSPYLLLGFLFAGILHIYFPDYKIYKYLGRRNFLSVFNAALIGVPLPLCSCGVIPTGLSFYKNGASKGSSVSFLISTPQTGVDSILVTYSLLGLPLAIIRPIIAFLTGIFGGILTNSTEKREAHGAHEFKSKSKGSRPGGIVEMLRYAFIEFLGDIAKWLLIGLLLAALISVLIPDDFFTTHINNNFIDMLLILVAAIPLYVCATGSVPIAAILMLKGLSPGAAIVFLMAGPATNIATITLIGKELGRKTLLTYLASIIFGALFFGYLVNALLPERWFISSSLTEHTHSIHFIPHWFMYITSAILMSLLFYTLIRNTISIYKSKKTEETPIHMETIKIKVDGMTCNHCKTTVENSINSLKGVESVEANIKTKEVIIGGEGLNQEQLQAAVEEKGYLFLGRLE